MRVEGLSVRYIIDAIDGTRLKSETDPLVKSAYDNTSQRILLDNSVEKEDIPDSIGDALGRIFRDEKLREFVKDLWNRDKSKWGDTIERWEGRTNRKLLEEDRTPQTTDTTMGMITEQPPSEVVRKEPHIIEDENSLMNSIKEVGVYKLPQGDRDNVNKFVEKIAKSLEDDLAESGEVMAPSREQTDEVKSDPSVTVVREIRWRTGKDLIRKRIGEEEI